MNLGFDAKRIFYNRSGLGNYGRNIINALLTLENGNNYTLYAPLKKKPLIDYTDQRVKVVNPVVFLHRKYGSFWRSFALGKLIEKDGIDVFHGLSNELPHNIHKRKVKTVVTIHDLIFLRYPELYKNIDKKIYNRKFSYACRVANRIIAISEQTKQDIIKFYNVNPGKIDVVYQGCNPIFLKKSEVLDKVKLKYGLPSSYMITVGTIEKRKNLLTILKAIKQGNIAMPLVVVGKPTKYLKIINEFINTNSLTNIYILNYVPLEDLPALYQGASLFLYPSIFEGFGIPVLEALYSQVPVITTNYGCFKEAGGDAALYINPESPDEMAEAIQSVLSSPERQQRMKEQGIKYAEQFKDTAIARKLMEVYKNTFQDG